MERKYVFYHTGLGLLTFTAGLIFVLFVLLSLMLWLPQSRWLHVVDLLVGPILIVWLAFRSEKWALGKKQERLSTT